MRKSFLTYVCVLMFSITAQAQSLLELWQEQNRDKRDCFFTTICEHPATPLEHTIGTVCDSIKALSTVISDVDNLKRYDIAEDSTSRVVHRGRIAHMLSEQEMIVVQKLDSVVIASYRIRLANARNRLQSLRCYLGGCSGKIGAVDALVIGSIYMAGLNASNDSVYAIQKEYAEELRDALAYYALVEYCDYDLASCDEVIKRNDPEPMVMPQIDIQKKRDRKKAKNNTPRPGD